MGMRTRTRSTGGRLRAGGLGLRVRLVVVGVVVWDDREEARRVPCLRLFPMTSRGEEVAVVVVVVVGSHSRLVSISRRQSRRSMTSRRAMDWRMKEKEGMCVFRRCSRRRLRVRRGLSFHQLLTPPPRMRTRTIQTQTRITRPRTPTRDLRSPRLQDSDMISTGDTEETRPRATGAQRLRVLLLPLPKPFDIVMESGDPAITSCPGDSGPPPPPPPLPPPLKTRFDALALNIEIALSIDLFTCILFLTEARPPA